MIKAWIKVLTSGKASDGQRRAMFCGGKRQYWCLEGKVVVEKAFRVADVWGRRQHGVIDGGFGEEFGAGDY